MEQPEVPMVGYRFHPTDEELINYYLINKLLGKTWLVNEAISELNIYDHDPDSLPWLSRIQSDDLVWYFFTPVLYTSQTAKDKRKRSTQSGFWKSTGKDRKISDKSGKREIGEKRTLVYHVGKVRNGVRTPWVMHEYNIKSLPHLHLPESYVICKIKYKGEKSDISYGNRSGEPIGSLVSDLNTVRAITTQPEFQVDQAGEEDLQGLSENDLLIPLDQHEDISFSDLLDPNMNNLQPQASYLAVQDNGDFLDGFDPVAWLNSISKTNVQPQTPYFAQNNQENTSTSQPTTGGKVQDMFSIGFIPQQDYNNYQPKPSLSGILVDYNTDSDCDAESISSTSYQGTSSPCDSIGSDWDAESISATSYQGTSSPCDSTGSSNRHFPSCRDETLSSSTGTDSCKYLLSSEDPSTDRKTRESQLACCTIPSKQEVKEDMSKAVDAYTHKEPSVAKTENDWFITEEAVEKGHKHPRHIYLVNMIVGVFLLLALIGNISSVLLPVKT